VSWIFCDADGSYVFTPQAGFITDLNSTPNYLTVVSESVLARLLPEANGRSCVCYGACNPIVVTCHPSADGEIENWLVEGGQLPLSPPWVRDDPFTFWNFPFSLLVPSEG